MSTPVLATKLFIPPPRPNAVLRADLIARLHAGLHGRLTLISAPAGFGKTSLVSVWIAGCGRPAAWLSLDDGDNDPARFLTHLVAALQTIAPTIGAEVAGALQSSQPPSPEVILTALLNDISAIPDHSILVLDDCHVIHATPLNQALAFLVEHLPSQLHLVMTTREDPPLPLARLRARGQLTELRAVDLRFTPSEATSFLTEVMGLRRLWYRYHHLFADVLQAHLQAEQPKLVATLHQRASGWYERQGSTSDAIRHALAGEDFTRAARLIETAVPAMRSTRQEVTVLGWLRALPDEVLRCRPVLSAAYAWVLLAVGELDGVERRLRDAERWLGTTADEPKRPYTAADAMVVVDDAEYGTQTGSAQAVLRSALKRSNALEEPLSERERDVLRLLRTYLSGPDIARELVMSLNTLRTHTKNIYDKLGVNSRQAAFRRAEELELF
jgi:LuxR family maltose regulon positive regulatory protein